MPLVSRKIYVSSRFQLTGCPFRTPGKKSAKRAYRIKTVVRMTRVQPSRRRVASKVRIMAIAPRIYRYGETPDSEYRISGYQMAMKTPTIRLAKARRTGRESCRERVDQEE